MQIETRLRLQQAPAQAFLCAPVKASGVANGAHGAFRGSVFGFGAEGFSKVHRDFSPPLRTARVLPRWARACGSWCKPRGNRVWQQHIKPALRFHVARNVFGLFAEAPEHIAAHRARGWRRPYPARSAGDAWIGPIDCDEKRRAQRMNAQIDRKACARRERHAFASRASKTGIADWLFAEEDIRRIGLHHIARIFRDLPSASPGSFAAKHFPS